MNLFSRLRNCALLAILFLISARAMGAPLTFAEENFSIDIPPGWVPMNPKPSPWLVAMQNPVGSKRLLLSTARFPASGLARAMDGVRSGEKAALIRDGCTIDPERRLMIGGLPFISFTAHFRSFASVVAYTGGAGNEAYMIQAIAKTGDPALDPELQRAVQSFHLLSAAPLPNNSSAASAGYAAGQFFGHVLFYSIVVICVIAVIRTMFSR